MHLSKLLLENGYKVFGLDRRTSAAVPAPCGNASRVKADLGWRPTTPLEGLAATMLEVDLQRGRDERP